MSKHVRALRRMATYTQLASSEDDLLAAADALETLERQLREARAELKAISMCERFSSKVLASKAALALEQIQRIAALRRVGAPKPAAGKRGRG
jgi:hypothetical protein